MMFTHLLAHSEFTCQSIRVHFRRAFLFQKSVSFSECRFCFGSALSALCHHIVAIVGSPQSAAATCRRGLRSQSIDVIDVLPLVATWRPVRCLAGC